VQLQNIGLGWRLEVAFKNKCSTEEVHQKLLECFPKLTGALYELGVKYQGSGEKLMLLSNGACDGQVFKMMPPKVYIIPKDDIEKESRKPVAKKYGRLKDSE